MSKRIGPWWSGGAAALTVLASAAAAPAASAPATAATPAGASRVQAATVVGGLARPSTFTVAKDGRVFYAELGVPQPRLAVYNPGTGAKTTLRTFAAGSRLLGLALDPAFSSRPYLYLYGVVPASGTLRQQLLRLTLAGSTVTSVRRLRDLGSRAQEHNGGRLRFGPDGRLYLSVGDHDDAANSQQLGNPWGKILRLTSSGAAAPGNPRPGGIHAYGLRNSFGFDFDPATRRLWASDNGPECNDELNRIVAGGDYAWGPHASCSTPPAAPANTNQDGDRLPSLYFGTSVAPTGVAFCSGCGLDGQQGRLLLGTFNTRQIRSVRLSGDRKSAAGSTVLYQAGSGITAVERAPGGAVLFSDSSGIRRLTG